MKKHLFCFAMAVAIILLSFTFANSVQATEATESTEPVVPTSCSHSYGGWNYCDSSTHSRTCTNCGNVETTRHTPDSFWYTDRHGHFRYCTGCDAELDRGYHVTLPAPSEAAMPYCGVCGRIMDAGFGHVHNYASVWTTSETGHWFACSHCVQKSNYGTHIFDQECDTDCSVCGYIRQVKHLPAEDWKSDETAHWQHCTLCGAKEGEAAHTPGAAATATTAQTCTTCGYEIAPATGVEDVTESGTDAPDNKDDGGTQSAGKTDKNNGLVLWIIIAVVVISALAAGIFVVKKKK